MYLDIVEYASVRELNSPIDIKLGFYAYMAEIMRLVFVFLYKW